MHRIALFVTAIAALGGCAPPDREAEGNLAPASRQTFGPEERRIAQALSIGRALEQDNPSPRFSAMLCTLALEAIDAKLQGSDLLNTAQSKAFAQARRMYSERAGGGLPASEQDKLRKEVEAAYPEEAERARLGLGCLQNLARS